MPTLRVKTTDELLAQAVSTLEGGGRITNFGPGSVGRTLIEAAIFGIADLYSYASQSASQRFPSTATGIYLDLLGDMVGISRRAATRAEVLASDRIIRFRATTGKLTDHLTAATIPSGTKITNDDGTIEFLTTEDIVVGSTLTEVFVPAEASVAGPDSNVGRGVLTKHDLGTSDISVTNVSAIQSGSTVESDASLRSRISNAFTGSASGNRSAVFNTVFAIPDVANLRFREYAQGTGTAEILVLPTRSRVGSAVLAAAREAIDEVRAIGTRITLREPVYVPIQVHVSLVFQPETTENQKSQARRAVTDALVGYFEDISVGGTMIVNRLRQIIISADSSIQDLSINCLVIGKRPQLLSNYTLAPDELFILDPDVNKPIDVQ